MSAGIAPGPILRDYQQTAVARLLDEIEQRRHAMLVMPTGAGKTVVAGQVVSDVVGRGGRVVAVAHRRELVSQFSKKLHAAGVVDHGIIQAHFPMRLGQAVQVCSIQTLHARTVLHKRIEAPPADLLIIDEAHRSRAKTYRALIDAYPGTPIIGMTATPCRGDGQGLGDIFDVLVETASTADLITAGYLVGTVTYAPTRPDLTGVRVEHGDYAEGQLAERMDRAQLVGDVVEHWHRLGDRRRTVVFASGVRHSLHLRDEFRRSGVRAEHIDGSTPTAERDAILAGLARGEIELVSNCMVLTEGWDQPEVQCLILARPTRHMGLYRQMVGRGLRPAPGKTDCLVLDHAGAVFAHGFVEEPVIWTLAPDLRAENPVHKARAEHKARALTTCPACVAVLRAGPPCSACGWRPKPKPVAVDVADGELGRVDRARRIVIATYGSAEKAAFHRMLAGIARERGYQRGWIAHKYREKFAEWPPTRNVEPLAPDAATRSWVKSRQIAYAKSMEKQRFAS